MTITAGQVKELRERTGAGMMECKKVLQESSGDLEQAIVLLRERGLSRAAKKAGRAAAEGKIEALVDADGMYGVLVEVNCETDFAAKNEDFVAFVNDAAQIALKNRISSVEKLREFRTDSGRTVADLLTDLISKVGENMTLRRVNAITSETGVVASYNHMGGKICTLVAIEGGNEDAVKTLSKDIAMHVAAAAPRYLNSSQVQAKELEQEKEIGRKRLLDEGKPEEMIEKILVGQINKFYKEVCLIDQIFIKDTSTNITKLLQQTSDKLSISSFLRFQLGEGVEKKESDFAAEVAAAAKGH